MPDICEAPNCENTLNGKRADAKYCSAACKLEAYHARKGIITKRDRDYDICQRDGCDEKIPESARADAKYCSNACRQKVYHKNHEEQEKAKREQVRQKHKERKEKQKDKEAVEEFIQELMGE